MRQFGTRRPELEYADRPGAYAVIFNGSGEIAIVRTPNGHFLPGGGVEPNEDLATALTREVREETGLGVRIGECFAEAAQYIYSDFEKRALNKQGTFFRADFAPLAVPCTPEPEHELLWMKVDAALAALKHDYQRWALCRALGLPEPAS